MVTVFLL